MEDIPTFTPAPPRPRQFVAVEFHPADRRSYTYHNDGEPVAIGDRVVVNTKKGTATVTVSGLPAAAPKGVETKAIVGKARPIATDRLGPVPEPGSPGPLPGTVYTGPLPEPERKPKAEPAQPSLFGLDRPRGRPA